MKSTAWNLLLVSKYELIDSIIAGKDKQNSQYQRSLVRSSFRCNAFYFESPPVVILAAWSKYLD